ncbi:MAG: hypothetical protein KDD84_00255 [Caldilineaceae bacterium]|nr:hypothetical protein [Caldilineaceae bacterium]
MTNIAITVEVPDELVKEAVAADLLSSDALVALIRQEIQRRRVDRLFAAADRLAALDLPVLDEAEIEEEIAAARLGRRDLNAPGA